MGQTILTTNQKKVIAVLSKESKLADFYLTGGTALSGYYLYHRLSDDLDFFIPADPDIIFLHGFANELKKELGAEKLRFERLYDRNQFFFKIGNEELKVEFTKYPFSQLENSLVKDGIKIDSLRDIAANKLMTILDRFDPKDFVDLFFIMRDFELENIRRDAEQKFEIKIDNIFLGGELAKVKRIEVLPKMIKEITIDELKEFFAKKAKELGLKIFE